MQRSKIEYLRGPDGREGFTWNPIKMRCSPASAGCANCWHLKFAKRHASNPTFKDDAKKAYRGGSPFLDREELMSPRRVKKSSLIAVQFMGDLFHDAVPLSWIQDVYGVIDLCPQHTFLVLTKRSKRLSDVFSACGPYGLVKNLWLGVSVEDQAAFDDRIPLLLRTPAAKRWVSVEPMLGPVDISDAVHSSNLGPRYAGIDLIVCGSETGPRKRPCHPEWVDSLRAQCLAAGVPFFGKVDREGKPIGPRQMP